jgi:hypothetical protein
MRSPYKRPSAKRVVTKTFFEYGVSPVKKESSTAGNYATFIVGVAVVFGIYLIAQAFGI